MARQYLKNLDGLRFIAAAIVAVSHLETIKSYASPSSLQNRFIIHAPQIAVTFFFVLSGFLIMWWFLDETKGELKKINVLAFYRNRISRTWPLYFLVVFASIMVSVFNGTIGADPVAIKRYLLYLFFMPNSADVLYRPDIYLGPAWSLAVEEFFYLFFPLLLMRLPKHHFLKWLVLTCGFFMLLSLLFSPVLLSMLRTKQDLPHPPAALTIFFERYRIYSFLLGAISACIFYSGWLDKFQLSNKAQRLLILCAGSCAALLTLFGVTFAFATQQVYSVMFALLLLLITYRGYSNRILNTSFFRWGGKISYGIYMLHMFVVLRVVNQLSFLIEWENYFISIVTSWTLLLLITCMLSDLSYRYFENPLRQKIRSRFSEKTDKI